MVLSFARYLPGLHKNAQVLCVLMEAQLKTPERKASDTESLAMKPFQFILKFELEIASKLIMSGIQSLYICVAFTVSNVIFAVVVWNNSCIPKRAPHQTQLRSSKISKPLFLRSQ